MLLAGLRERKKLQLRRGLQRVALRLFAAQGYDETTVEQIVTRPSPPSSRCSVPLLSSPHGP